jgi:DNA-binding transcriptional LysR family regulator
MRDLNAALFFVRVVDAGSFRGAARALGVPKSTVSRKLAELEERLGARLLQRTTRRIGLTDVGRGYYAKASAAVAALLDAERSVGEHLGEPRGTLRITAPLNFGPLLIGPAVVELLTRYPKVEVDLELSERIVDLVREGFDLAVRAGPLADSSLVARRIGGGTMHVYGSPKYFRRRGRPRTPEELASHDCLVFASIPGPWIFSAEGKPLSVRVSGRLAANDLSLLRDAAVSGLGVARLPDVLAAPLVRAKKLERVLADFAPPQAPLHVVYPSARFVSPTVRAFVEILEKGVPRLVGAAS